MRAAVSGQLLEPGAAYVAAHGTHVIVNPDARLTVSLAPPRHLFRPSADWLFESSAASFGPRHTAVVLSGLLFDGSASLKVVKHHGGTVLAQAPDSARFSDMPSAAIASGHVDRVLPPDAIAAAIRELVAARNVLRDRADWDDPFGASEVA